MRLLLPALLVAGLGVALVAAGCGGGKSDDERVAAIIHRLLVSASAADTAELESFAGRLPEGLPAPPPAYPDARLIVSSRRPAAVVATRAAADGAIPEPTLYFIVYDTDASRQQVLDFYLDALDDGGWQLESAYATVELDSLQFSNSEDADLSGVVSIARGGGDARTSILISMQDAGAFRRELPPYRTGESLPLPRGFPPDLPIYQDATVIGNALVRAPGNDSYLVDFITTASASDVLAFYRDAFAQREWTVLAGAPLGVEQRLDFHDETSDIQGELLTEAFPKDARFTEVKLRVEVNPERTPAALTPQPSRTPARATATPRS
jgi:hypothetical protein